MKRTILIIIIFILIGIVGFLVSTNQKVKNPTLPSSPSQNNPQTVSPTNMSENTIGAGGSSYLDEKGVYSVLYPNDYVLDNSDPIHIRIYKRGESQRPQSEMSDGVVMVFESLDLAGMSLEKWVDTRIKQDTADGTTEVVESKKAVNQNSYPGFRYALRGLGTSQNLVLQKDATSQHAVLVTYSVSDPENKGYQKEVDAVLSSIKLVK